MKLKSKFKNYKNKSKLLLNNKLIKIYQKINKMIILLIYLKIIDITIKI